VRDIETLDAELRLVAALRGAARERGGPLPSIDVADALLDERSELTGLPGLTRCLSDSQQETPIHDFAQQEVCGRMRNKSSPNVRRPPVL
jgi:hypothetical protein